VADGERERCREADGQDLGDDLGTGERREQATRLGQQLDCRVGAHVGGLRH
jgi:hypothetical protein